MCGEKRQKTFSVQLIQTLGVWEDKLNVKGVEGKMGKSQKATAGSTVRTSRGLSASGIWSGAKFNIAATKTVSDLNMPLTSLHCPVLQ